MYLDGLACIPMNKIGFQKKANNNDYKKGKIEI